jgi:uncharacterized protein YbcI
MAATDEQLSGGTLNAAIANELGKLIEQTIMDSGQPSRVVAMREEFQSLVAERYKETIEELTGCKANAFLSHAHVEPDITVEMFFVDGTLPGFGALELIDPE